MFLDAGFSYVYKSFRGRNDCFNVTSDFAGIPAAVLIRALVPVEGLERMIKHRQAASGQKNCNQWNVCSGPAKLCQALLISREEMDGVDLTAPDACLFLEEGEPLHLPTTDDVTNKETLFLSSTSVDKGVGVVLDPTAAGPRLCIDESKIVATPRINIQYAQEWSHKPLRFCRNDWRRYLSFPIGGSLSPKNPCMITPDQYDLATSSTSTSSGSSASSQTSPSPLPTIVPAIDPSSSLTADTSQTEG
jgi:3-methyladenine DNA glycosylase Mpg